MRSFWIWFSFLAMAWFCAFVNLTLSGVELPWRIAGCAMFFAVYFISPLFRQHSVGLTIILSVASLIAIVTLWPAKDGVPNLYILLVYSIIAGEAVYRLSHPRAIVIGLILMLGALGPYYLGYPAITPMFIVLYSLLLATALIVFHKMSSKEVEVSAWNEALLSEYRKMKRRMISNEQVVRQDERAQVGRDIHDSVGHKLTALLLQLEVFRMQVDDEAAAKVQDLKELARESLEETRNAVKTLKHEEVGGLPAILNLIRKLEAENILRVNFTVKHGALSAPISNIQSIAVYRAVQESLTNIMRHSTAREADVLFEAPGGGVFRFEVSNALTESKPFREGFGLRSMRERMETAGGQVEVIPYKDRFVVRGTLSMVKKGGAEI
ncbi:sensor histidine kinase [Paenibacillus anaericanus]|uniref:histidine kinase n=1 Tax=Paenibacillus anaericanus TaxID=170367 RepID=A0A3S1EKC4_9BACL|nr:sensor histidine kinase [Paenibacillus anaericanus]RUT47453.1 sensor histidine kinase [Paenibacillus anaericanus]